MEETKQFGKYHGILKDPEEPKVCSEQELYFIINSFGGFIWKMNHDMANGRIKENIDLTKYQYAVEYCVYQSTRFGVEIPELKENDHVKTTDSYWDWFKWWDSYFQNKLTKEEFKEYENTLKANGDISKYRPEGDWRKVI